MKKFKVTGLADFEQSVTTDDCKLKCGSLLIKSASEDSSVRGFTFVITGPDSYEREVKTNEFGFVEVSDLYTGTYTVAEKDTDQTDKYILPEEKTVDVTYTQQVVLSFYNVLKPIEPAIYGSMIVKKTSKVRVKSGFMFRITGPCYEKETVTDDSGVIELVNLIPGEYKVVEVKNDAVTSSILPKAQILTVKASRTNNISFE